MQLVCDRANLFASGCAAGRAFPVYNMKTGDHSQADKSEEARGASLVYISPNTQDAPLSAEEAHTLNCAIKGILEPYCVTYALAMYSVNCVLYCGCTERRDMYVRR